MKRPISVTIISWLFIISGIFAIARKVFYPNDSVEIEIMKHTPLPVVFQIIWFYVGAITHIVSGIFMLFGANWARILYFIMGVAGLIVAIFSPVKFVLIAGLGMYSILIFFLSRPKVKVFFTKANTKASNSPQM